MSAGPGTLIQHVCVRFHLHLYIHTGVCRRTAASTAALVNTNEPNLYDENLMTSNLFLCRSSRTISGGIGMHECLCADGRRVKGRGRRRSASGTSSALLGVESLDWRDERRSSRRCSLTSCCYLRRHGQQGATPKSCTSRTA